MWYGSIMPLNLTSVSTNPYLSSTSHHLIAIFHPSIILEPFLQALRAARCITILRGIVCEQNN